MSNNSDLRAKYKSFDNEIDWIVDAMHSDAMERLFGAWEKAEPRPSVAEVKQLLWAYSDGLADAWEEHMDGWEGDGEPDPDDAPAFSQAVEWLIREYANGAVWDLYEAIDLERGRHKNVDTSNVMVEAILFRQDRELAEGWTEWAKVNR
jgi:hypothetical protein